MFTHHRILLGPESAAGAAAPAAPAAPSAPAAPDNSGVRSTPQLNTAFDALDTLLADNPPPEKPAESAEPAEKPNTPPSEKPVVEDKSKTPPAKPEKAATLRENYERLKADLIDRDARLSKYQQMEKDGKLGDEEKKTFTEKLTAAEKRRNELEEHIKFVDYQKSQEYQEKYQKPFEDAYARGRESASQYKITDATTGELRQATPEDFDAIMAVSDPDAAASKIEELFGTGVKAQNVAMARQKVLDAFNAKKSALEDFSKRGSEISNQRMEANQKFQSELAAAWKAERDAGLERLPTLFKPVGGDDKGNSALEDGYRLADLAFGALDSEGVSKLPKWVQERMVDGKLPPMEMAKLHAAIRNKAGAFDRTAYQLKQERAKSAELQKQLDGYKKSSSPEVELGRERVGSEGSLDSVDAMIERMAR